MECPRCTGRLKRIKTVDGKQQVIRYNKCLSCGERTKTIELYIVDYESNVSTARIEAIQEKRKAEQLTLDLDTIKTAFQTLQSVLIPQPGPTDRLEEASSVPARYTKDFALRRR